MLVMWNVNCEPGISVSMVSGYEFGRPGNPGSIPGRGENIFPVAFVSKPGLGPVQPNVQWVPGPLFLGLKCGRGVTLTTPPPPN
jgi:hypothetical protein